MAQESNSASTTAADASPSSSPSALITRFDELQNELVALKQDRTTYIRSADVLQAYDRLCQLLEAAHKLKATGETKAEGEKIRDVWRRIEDCFQLMSLFYLTIGRNNEPPATYAPCIVIKRLLEHLTESGNYSRKDLAPISHRLQTFGDIIARDEAAHPKLAIEMLTAKLWECEKALKPLHEVVDKIAPGLQETHEKLVSLRRCIKAAEAKLKFLEAEVNTYLDQIKEIDATRKDGKFVADDGTIPEQGQEMVETLLGRCYAMAEEALKRQGDVPAGLRPTADELYRLKIKLEKLELTQAWSLRETDLYDYQRKLSDLDESRVGGRFVGRNDEAPTTDEGQSILLYMLRRCYAHVYTLISSSEPVSEALTPIFNQLRTVRQCLMEVQKFGIQNTRELYPYSMKLASIDDMRVDGKFMVGNDIPEGQGRVISLLSECFEICQELREAA